MIVHHFLCFLSSNKVGSGIGRGIDKGLDVFETPVMSEDEGGRLGLPQSGQTLHLLGVPPIAALTFYFPSLRSIVKSLLANQPQRLASAEMSHSIQVRGRFHNKPLSLKN